MRAWKMSSRPVLICCMKAAVNRLDCVNTMCCNAQHDHVVVGDTGGHVRVWKLDPHLCSSTGAAAQACFTQVCSLSPFHTLVWTKPVSAPTVSSLCRQTAGSFHSVTDTWRRQPTLLLPHH